MRACAIIPAFEAEATIGDVVAAARDVFRDEGSVIVVDDGSTDHTARIARHAGALVLGHAVNRGKGAALRTGLRFAFEQNFEAAVSIDADGQHPPSEAERLLADPDPVAIVLGIRNLTAAGAPRANRFSNGISNFFLSLFAGRAFADTQCGMRRYPLPLTLALDAEDDGYAFEAEIILRAVTAGIRIVETDVRVIYPKERRSHFDSVRDPARIVSRVVKTLVATRGLRKAPDGAMRVSRPPPPSPPSFPPQPDRLPESGRPPASAA